MKLRPASYLPSIPWAVKFSRDIFSVPLAMFSIFLADSLCRTEVRRSQNRGFSVNVFAGGAQGRHAPVKADVPAHA
jgi:hypothetical protein